jgi:diguanylate cyclase (GGDEF)-like protein
MSELMFAAAAGLPLAAGWSVHALRLTRRIESARRDPLTGLWTREAFEQRAGRLLARHPHVVVVLVDLDGFKAVNDRHGHDAGDALLVEVARRLAGCVRGSDLVARLGGDEFGLISETAGDEGDCFAGMAERLVAALAAPADLGGGFRVGSARAWG